MENHSFTPPSGHRALLLRGDNNLCSLQYIILTIYAVQKWPFYCFSNNIAKHILVGENLPTYFLCPYFDSFYNQYLTDWFSIVFLESWKIIFTNLKSSWWRTCIHTFLSLLQGTYGSLLHATFGAFRGAEPLLCTSLVFYNIISLPSMVTRNDALIAGNLRFPCDPSL